MVSHLRALKRGEAVDCPVYDFTIHNRSDKVLSIEPKPVIIVDGILNGGMNPVAPEIVAGRVKEFPENR